MKTFNVYSDPGHGWAKVPLKVIQKLGLAEKISHYSYIRKEHAYLEEDRDLELLVNAVRKHLDAQPKFIQHYGDKQSKIRGYCSYDPTKIDWTTCKVKGQ